MAARKKDTRRVNAPPEQQPTLSSASETEEGTGRTDGQPQLASALKKTRNELQITSQVTESSSEERKAFNDEILSTDGEPLSSIQELHRHLAAIVESSADAIFSKDLDGIIQTWNQGAERLYGYTRDEAVGRSVRTIIPEDRAEELSSIMNRLRRGESIEQLATERLCKDGRRIPVSLTISPMRDSNGMVVSASVIARDMSESRRDEIALRESEKRFRLMADTAPVMIWLSGIDKVCTWTNKPWLDFTGRPMEQQLGNGWAENIHPDDLDHCLGTYTAAFDARQPFSMEYRLKRYDGKYRWLLDHGVPLNGPDGGFAGYIGSCVDITERREAEEAVAATYRHLKLAMSAGRMAAWTWDPHKDVVSLSENFREICGVSRIADRKQGESLLHPDDRSRHGEIVDFAVKHGTPYQSVVRLVRPDNGQIVWLDLRAVPVTDIDGHVTTLSGLAIDITKRKQGEADLLASEERLRAILDTAMDAIITIDQRGIIQSVNAATERMFGYSAAEMIGQSVNILMPSPHQEAHDGYLTRYLETGDKHIIGITREVEAQRKDGSIFPADLAVSEISHLKLFTGIHRDLTQRKQLERDVVEAASLEQRRIGQDLHDSVAQELTALNLLARDLSETFQVDPPKAVQLVEQITQGLQRSQKELRAVMRGLLPVAVDGEGLMSALADLADRTDQEGKVACLFDCPEPVSLSDNLAATHLYLIAQEAVHNAVKHSQARMVRIALHADGELVLSIQDDGIGMADQLPYPFPSPLWGERKTEEGLGLRIMRNRATIIGARLTIERGEPSGAVVTCMLPCKSHEPEKDKEENLGPHRR
jgi:PAS domain S-box-containing protein